MQLQIDNETCYITGVSSQFYHSSYIIKNVTLDLLFIFILALTSLHTSDNDSRFKYEFKTAKFKDYKKENNFSMMQKTLHYIFNKTSFGPVS